ncbi:MAG: DMT family transporter [Acidaminobacteraceae bacterium]
MDKRNKAIIMLALAAVLWSTGGILIKLVEWNSIAIAGVRSGISAILMLVYLKYMRKKNTGSSKLNIKLTKVKLIGACIYASTVILFVVANKLTSSANVILLQYTAPIWVAVFSGLVLNEKVRKADWTSIVCVMFGMGLFFVGDIEKGEMLGNIFAALSGLSLAGVILTLKLQEDGTAVEMTFIGNGITFLIGIPFMLLSIPSLTSILGLILLGVFQLGLAYILFAESVKHVSAVEAILVPVIEPLLNPVWVFVFAGETPKIMAVIGGTIVVLSVVIRSVYTSMNDKKVKSKNLVC